MQQDIMKVFTAGILLQSFGLEDSPVEVGDLCDLQETVERTLQEVDVNRLIRYIHQSTTFTPKPDTFSVISLIIDLCEDSETVLFPPVSSESKLTECGKTLYNFAMDVQG